MNFLSCGVIDLLSTNSAKGLENSRKMAQILGWLVGFYSTPLGITLGSVNKAFRLGRDMLGRSARLCHANNVLLCLCREVSENTK